MFKEKFHSVYDSLSFFAYSVLSSGRAESFHANRCAPCRSNVENPISGCRICAGFPGENPQIFWIDDENPPFGYLVLFSYTASKTDRAVPFVYYPLLGADTGVNKRVALYNSFL